MEALMVIPYQDAVTLHNAIVQGIALEAASYALPRFLLPCNTTAKVALSFQGHPFYISPMDYVGQPLNDARDLCLSNIVGQNDSQQWVILGVVFLKNVNSI